MPRFSVVVPTYNRSEVMRRSVASVLGQTYTDFEIIVADDGSTDHTNSVVQSFADNRIRYLWLPNSGGPAKPRNVGIDEADSEWVCFLDSDDLWYPTKLEVVDQALALNPDVDAVSNDEILHFPASGKKRLIKNGPFNGHFPIEKSINRPVLDFHLLYDIQDLQVIVVTTGIHILVNRRTMLHHLLLRHNSMFAKI